jgi:hypothetical protein
MGVDKRMTKTMRGVALAATLPLLLHACAYSDGAEVTAYVTKGPLNGSECTLYRAETNDALVGPVTSESGYVSFGMLNYHGLAYVACTGGTYTDEVNGQVADIDSVTLRAAKPISGKTHFIITPLTEIAVRHALALGDNRFEQDNVQKANAEITDRFGLGDTVIVADNPTNIRDENAIDNASGRYGILMAAFSKLIMEGEGSDVVLPIDGVVSVGEKLEALLADFLNKVTDKQALISISDALNMLVLSENMKEAIPIDVTIRMLKGFGGGEDVVLGQQMTGLSIVSAASDSIPSKKRVNVLGNGFIEGIKVFIDGVLVEDIEVHSNSHLSFKSPGEFTSGDVKLVVSVNGEEAQLKKGVIYACGHDICSRQFKDEGCFFVP